MIKQASNFYNALFWFFPGVINALFWFFPGVIKLFGSDVYGLRKQK